MLNVLFVCYGNICRSPVAEGVFRQLVADAGLDKQIQADSAGTASFHIGQLSDRRTRENALEHGLTLTHRARRLTGDYLAQFDYFVAMDETNLEAIEKLNYRSTGLYSNDTIFLLREFDPDVNDQPNVPDPYYEGPEVFEEVYQIALRCCRQLLTYLIQQHNLNERKSEGVNE
ncbi:low molecular weight phosphotyrosine protein phosphatase [Spirosoma sp. KCTC 42546]|uniref:low molecular weight protein-tyrosine-phosphatase n=1 Tax=Spirosoma sp. KCTC 42546 TaxID=2520506 RepID=UPI001158A85A|nr:low molecular weight protein-tyrosine-phosphatase [Spirosoma sp. KCTC 42546]QDK83236.1 low molecular weight phosphotyrosine protein phosphatase [Spirosoma sp. KCTC 42546]